MVFEVFATQPPEVISGQVYSGPGAAPLLAAAAAWSGLAGELHATASSYSAVLSGLGDDWQGPAAQGMVLAVTPYVQWLTTTAGQAEQTAAGAQAAARAYELAFTGVVPPPAIAANRSQLASLVAGNLFGQNSAAIAETEIQYLQMWAQDVAVMIGYGQSARSATQLTAFTTPRQATSEDGASNQAAAAAQAAGSSGQSSIAQVLRDLPGLPHEAARSALNALTGNTSAADAWEAFYGFQSSVGSEASWSNAVGGTQNLAMAQVRNFHKLPGPPVIPKAALGVGLSSPGGALGALSGGGPSAGVAGAAGAVKAASATAGAASTVGALSVPPTWATASPAIQLASTASPVATPVSGMAAAPSAGLANGVLSPAALGSLTGGALGTPVARAGTTGVQVMSASTKDRNTPVKLDQVIAQLQQTPDAVQHWNVDEAGLDDLVAKLSLRPGIHAVHVCADGETLPTEPQSALG